MQDALTPEDMVSIGLDFTPGVGNAKGMFETVSGYDQVTGEPINRWMAGAGTAIPFVARSITSKIWEFSKNDKENGENLEKPT